MSKIIFLNGCGSSGKTSIARSIQYLSSDDWLTFGIDTFIKMTPLPSPNKTAKYLDFVPGKSKHGQTLQVQIKPKGEKLFGLMPEFADLLAHNGHNLIIDEVLFGDALLKSYVKKLNKHTVYFAGIYCDLEAMQEREFLRQDRAIGLSNDQANKVHTGLREYDLTIDTTLSSNFDSAQQILEFIKKNPYPEGFKKMQAELK
ncbi:MAG: hypothetical protein JKY15_04960 [Deltaproteobacteria bacterium]|nr:hypothetical protein [Deltaproteobacteria bacterium]